MSGYRQYQRDLAPAWLQGPFGAKWLEAHGQTKDDLVALLIEAVKARSPRTGPDDALALTGQERNLSRHPGERTDAYRDRLVGAFDFWVQAGTEPGIHLAIEQLGYKLSLIPMRSLDPARWSEFLVVIRPGAKQYGVPNWGPDGLWEDDGQLWGLDLTAEEQARIREVIDLVKPAHTKPADVIFYAEQGALWGEGGNWENDGLWEPARITPF